MISSLPLPPAARSLQPVKVLAQRSQYTTCHIQVPDDPQRLAAIFLNGRYYSFFRLCNQAQKAVGLMLKLTGRGDAVVITPTHRGHAIWVHEPEAIAPVHPPILPDLGPADCWVISDRQPQYRTCNLQVPDLPDAVPGLTNGQRFYSLYRREDNGDTALKLVARLTQRGDEVIILVTNAGYILCIHEPGATLVA